MLELRVLTGLHRGVTIPLGGDDIRIGKAPDNDTWTAEPMGSTGGSNTPAAVRPRRNLIVAVAATLLAASAVTVALVTARLGSGDRPIPTHAPPAGETHTSPRVTQSTVYPPDTDAHPPFGIKRIRGGAYGFVVTDDGRVLTPGSRWQAFTLMRIEPDRAVFAGPHAVEAAQ